MNDKDTKDSDKGQVVDGLKAVTAAIQMFTTVPKEVYSVLQDLPDKLRPNYRTAAEGFREIAQRLRESFDRVNKLLNKAIDLNSKSVKLKQLR